LKERDKKWRIGRKFGRSGNGLEDLEDRKKDCKIGRRFGRYEKVLEDREKV